MTDDDGDTAVWVKLFDRETTREELEDVIHAQAAAALETLHESLVADPDLTLRDRAAVLAKSEPLILERVRGVLEPVWRRLHAEAQPSTNTTVH